MHSPRSIAMPLLLIQPVWTFIVLIAFVAYWLVVLAFIGTSGESVSESSPSSPTGSSCSPSSAQAVSQSVSVCADVVSRHKLKLILQ